MDIISTTLTNPCPLPKEKGQLGKSRGLCAWDLIKPRSRFKTIKTQQEIQECSRPSFDHPKMLHILIDRAAGYGCKKLAKADGGSAGSSSKFCQSMGFDIIKPHEVIDQQPNPKHLSLEERAIKLMEEDRTSELKSIAKYDEQRHWGAQDHPATTAWKVQKRYHSDIEYRIYQNIQVHMHSSLGAGKFVSRRLKEVLGCTVTEFKAHCLRHSSLAAKRDGGVERDVFLTSAKMSGEVYDRYYDVPILRVSTVRERMGHGARQFGLEATTPPVDAD